MFVIPMVASVVWLVFYRVMCDGMLGGTATVGRVVQDEYFLGQSGGRYVLVPQSLWQTVYVLEWLTTSWLTTGWLVVLAFAFFGRIRNSSSV